MPFLGGATLAAVLPAREAGTIAGATCWRRSTAVAAPEYLAAGPAAAPAAISSRRPSHPEAAAWIVARLAEALDHAARLGVTHGDLKPANILIAADGRPMLFDFNLAVDWRRPPRPLAGTGGTLAYMAPERLRALADPKSAACADGRPIATGPTCTPWAWSSARS